MKRNRDRLSLRQIERQALNNVSGSSDQLYRLVGEPRYLTRNLPVMRFVQCPVRLDANIGDQG